MIDDQLRRRGIGDQRVLQVMARIPRENFVPQSLTEAAYEDRALDIGLGQTISQPYIVAYMTEKLNLQPDHRVLEIGTGSGYQTAVLASLCAEVCTLEHLAILSQRTQSTLARLGIENVEYRIDDGSVGWPERAPFDRIMVTAGAPAIPRPLVEQLRDGGRMIVPVGDRKLQQLLVIEKREGRFIEYPLIGCRFVKLIGHCGWPGESTTL